MFSATVKSGTRFNSWKIMAMPRSLACRGLVKRTGSPATSDSPASGGNTPARMFINVDFPAPFSPSRAVSRPRRSVRPTPSNAFTPGKDLESPRASRMMSPASVSLMAAATMNGHDL